MFLFKCFKAKDKHDPETEPTIDDAERVDPIEQESNIYDQVKLVYFSCTTLNQDLINAVNSLTQNTIQTFTLESECVEYINSITTKVFLIIDGSPSTTLRELIEPMKHIDSLFIYSSSFDSSAVVSQKEHTYLVILCRNEEELVNSIKQSCAELNKQIAAFSMYNKNEKRMRDLSKEGGSFLYFQLFLNDLKRMPKTAKAKTCMITTCRNYYRGNSIELKNIDEFDRTYRSIDAISWYTKDTFLSKFINKVLRTEVIDVLYQFRFYILDLSEQLELKFLSFKQKQKGVVKLYQALNLNNDELVHFQKNIGNTISPNGYLLTTSERSIAYDSAIKSAKTEDDARVLIEYQVDLTVVQNIAIADIREYSASPEEAQVLVDIGASFQIDSCQFNAEEDLWYIRVHATDHGVPSAVEYMEYQKKKMAESNIVLMFGDLLFEMGEYDKAERYFDTILSSSNPNDEEIACIFFHFGRIHRKKGRLDCAINCYHRAYSLHMNARPERSASAGKALNGLGVVYSEQDKQLKAEECFQRAMKLYSKSLPKKHIDVAGTLINLGIVDYNRADYDRALDKYLQAQKIYDHSLPSVHPSCALLKINLGNLYLSTGDYEKALKQYESALKIQELSLPSDHPDVVQTHRGIIDQAKEYLERAQESATRTLSSKHQVEDLLTKTKDSMIE